MKPSVVPALLQYFCHIFYMLIQTVIRENIFSEKKSLEKVDANSESVNMPLVARDTVLTERKRSRPQGADFLAQKTGNRAGQNNKQLSLEKRSTQC
jgi:hypothetical protein